jgi:tetratricopeptide (TPR) repeat protein
METGSEEVNRQINNSATDKLTKSSLGMAYILKEQGGIDLDVDENDSLKLSPETNAKITSLLGVTELTSQLRHSLFEQSSLGVIADTSKAAPESKVVFNQDKFVQAILGENPKLINKLAEIVGKSQIFTDVLDQQPNETSTDIKFKVKTWKNTIDTLAQTLCSSKTERDNYQRLVTDSVSRLNNPSERTINTNGEVKTVTVESYSSRLNKLIQNPRAIKHISVYINPRQGEVLADDVVNEYLETAFTLNSVKVLDRIQRPLGFNGKFRKLTACLREREIDPIYTQIIKNNGLVDDFNKLSGEIEKVVNSSLPDNEKKQKIEELNNNFKEQCRPIIKDSFLKETDHDEEIDIVGTKDKLAELYKQADKINSSELDKSEKQQKLASLDEQIQLLLVPIANKVERLFPHENSTNLTDVLEKEEAICAGKVNVLLAISKYLGINARANTVKETLNNETSGHVCYECDLPSGSKLIIDANFGNKGGLEGKTDDELIALIRQGNPGISDSELQFSLKYAHLAIINAKFVPQNSRVLIYTTKNTGEIVADDNRLQEVKTSSDLLVKINPYTGQKEIWKASIPYPHLITAPDKDGYLYINSSFTNNTAHFVGKGDLEIGIYLFKRHIEMNPYDALAYTGLAELLPKVEGLALLEKIKLTKTNLYWETMSVKHAIMYANQNDLDKAFQLFQETKINNPSAYYKNVHELSQCLRDKAKERTQEEVIELNSKAIQLMESAQSENPSVFYSTELNVMEMDYLYENQIDKKVRNYEEFQKIKESMFWNPKDIRPAFHKLMDFYIEQSKNNPAVRDKALSLMGEIKTRNPEFYTEKIHSYVSDLYLDQRDYQPSLAIITLEEAKINSPKFFFQEYGNITALAQLYEDQQDIDKAIGLYEESKSINPDLFWTYSSVYESLVGLYKKNGQIDKAIEIYKEAKIASPNFWDISYEKGYHQLATIYTEIERLPEAISISLEAQSKDPNFLNPKFNNGGYIQLASLYEKNGQIDKAIEVMLQGQEIDNNFWISDYTNPNAFNLTNLYEKDNQFDKAISILEKVKEKNNDYLKTDYYKICELYDKSGNHEKAKQSRLELISLYEKLKISNPDLYHRLTENLADLYLKQDQVEKAIEVLEEGKNNFDYFPINRIITLAELYLQLGNTKKARASYLDAIKIFKDFNRPDSVRHIIQAAKKNGIEIADT